VSRRHDVYELTFSTRRLSNLLEDAGWSVTVPSDQRDGVLRFVSDPVEGTVKLERVLFKSTGREMISVGVEELTGRSQTEVVPRGQYL